MTSGGIFKENAAMPSAIAGLCALCQVANHFKVYAKFGGYILKKCEHCALVFTDGVNPDEVTALYHEDDYYSSKGGSGFNVDGFIQNGLHDGLAKYYDRYRLNPLFKFVQNFLPKRNIKYLDIGCSAGLMLALARLRDWQVEGVETSQVAAQYAAEKLKLKVHCSDLESLNLKKASFDVISLFHVLEHLKDPRRSLKLVGELLTGDGVLAIEVPNINSLPAKLRPESWHGYVLPYHLWHFSLATLTELLKQSGFKVEFSYTPFVPCSGSHILNVHRGASWLYKTMRTLAGAPAAKEANKGGAAAFTTSQARSKWVQNIIHTFYWPADQAMARSGAGEALYVIARKL